MPRALTVFVLITACTVGVVTRGLAATEAVDGPITRTVFLDAGHGGSDSGATQRNALGSVDLREKDVNLGVALKTAELLNASGYRVVLSRETDKRPGNGKDTNGDGRITHRDGLQSAVDLANQSGADLFISLHSNSSSDSSASGLEVYYCAEREFAADSVHLAELVQYNLLRVLRGAGYEAVDRGVKDDSVLYRWRDRQGHLFVLGPVSPRGRRQVHPRSAAMPGVLAEALFLSNDVEAGLLVSEEGQWALPQAMPPLWKHTSGISRSQGNPLFGTGTGRGINHG